MSNLKAMIFFALGSLVIAVALVALEVHERIVAQPGAHVRLSALADASPDYINFGAVTLVKKDGVWMMEEPVKSETDPTVVARLLDALSFAYPDDIESDAELARMGHRLSVFGLAPARVTVTLGAGPRRETIRFGAPTPSGEAVYARVDGMHNVFTLPKSVTAAIPPDADSCRRTNLVSFSPELVDTIEIRSPGAPFLKIVHDAQGWHFASPVKGPADGEMVLSLVSRLCGAKVDSFADGADDTACALDGESGFAITVKAAALGSQSVTFGSQAGEGRVYVKFGGGIKGVVSNSLASFCRDQAADFRDIRYFPLELDDAVKVAISDENDVYILARGTNRVWRLDSPVSAPADPVEAEAFVRRVLSIRRSDLRNEGVRVSASSSSVNFPAATVSGSLFSSSDFSKLRSRILLEARRESVRRITLKTAAGAETRVERDAARGMWNLVRRFDDTGSLRVSQDAVKRLLSALERVEAESVVTLAGGPEELGRYGLEKPTYTLTVDLVDGRAIRCNILLGAVAAEDGTRYATMGRAEAIFTVSPATVSVLTAPLTE